jgi:predicted RNase H-like HicB family nuclease
LPGCVAIGETRKEDMTLIRGAIAFHLQGTKEDGELISKPHSKAEVVEVLTT